MSIKLRYAARCEAAGRDHNEDNFLLDNNLNDDTWGFNTEEIIPLEGRGALLLVCDGMGGQNAGEIASAIAVETIKKWFERDKVTPEVTASSASILKYISNAIQAADAAIKEDAQANPEHEGMGSTIVLAWLINGKIYVGWCGDSRAYRYNPQTGLERLSHDHSYVQDLVDAGKLTEELAFDHPNSNIITRSLGDPRGKAQPDVKEYDIYNDDIILLCSDGLCGCLRDNEIENILAQHRESLVDCRDTLWEADEAAGWHDNVTIVMAQTLSGAPVVDLAKPSGKAMVSNATLLRQNKSLKTALYSILCALLIGLCLLGLYFWRSKGQPVMPEAQDVESVEEVQVGDEQVIDTLVEEQSKKAEKKQKATNTNQKSVKQQSAEQPNEIKAPVQQAPELTPVNKKEGNAETSQSRSLTPILSQEDKKQDSLNSIAPNNGKEIEVLKDQDTVVTIRVRS